MRAGEKLDNFQKTDTVALVSSALCQNQLSEACMRYVWAYILILIGFFVGGPAIPLMSLANASFSMNAALAVLGAPTTPVSAQTVYFYAFLLYFTALALGALGTLCIALGIKYAVVSPPRRVP